MYRSYNSAEVWEFECQKERFLVYFKFPDSAKRAHWITIVLCWRPHFFNPKRCNPKDDLPSEARLSYTKRCWELEDCKPEKRSPFCWRKRASCTRVFTQVHFTLEASTWEFGNFYGVYELDGVLMDLMRHKYNVLLAKILSYLMLIITNVKSLSSYFVGANPTQWKPSFHHIVELLWITLHFLFLWNLE